MSKKGGGAKDRRPPLYAHAEERLNIFKKKFNFSETPCRINFSKLI